MSSIGSFRTQQDARLAASKNAGNESITLQKDGSYNVSPLNAQENKDLINKDFSKFSKDTIEFSVDNKGSKNKLIDEASEKTNNNLGNESIVKNQDGSFSVFPFLDDKSEDIQEKDFSKSSESLIESSVQESNTESKIIDLKERQGGAKSQKLLENIDTLMTNIKNKKMDTNSYTRGAEKVDIDKGIVNADCSGFVSAMMNSAGVSMPRMLAASIGKMVRNPENPYFDRVNQAKDIKPGDVISYESVKGGITGHIVIAIGNPEPVKKNGKVISYNIRVADSTSIKHTNDDRRGGRGAGTGTISIDVDTAGNMKAFRWGVGSGWNKETGKVTAGRIKE